MDAFSSASFSGRRVALTGATGFVGFHLARPLTQHGAQVTALVRASSNVERLLRLGVSCVTAPLDMPPLIVDALSGCELLFHLAGAVDFEGDWDRFRQVNVEGTRNVVAAAKAAGVRRVVHVSSIVAVGAGFTTQPLDETARWNLGSLRVPYVTTKHEAEEVALAANGPSCEVVVANPGSIIGPDDFTNSEFGTLCRRFWRGKVPVCFTGGTNFVDVRDVADGLLRLARCGRAGERYLLTGWNRTYSQFFAELARVSPRRHPRVTLPAAVAPLLAAVGERFARKTARPALSRSQARLLGMYFYYGHAKAAREVGFSPRQLAETIADTHRFFFPEKPA